MGGHSDGKGRWEKRSMATGAQTTAPASTGLHHDAPGPPGQVDDGQRVRRWAAIGGEVGQ
jgi:hypothetical protein